jgi:hypothetical protein
MATPRPVTVFGCLEGAAGDTSCIREYLKILYEGVGSKAARGLSGKEPEGEIGGSTSSSALQALAGDVSVQALTDLNIEFQCFSHPPVGA